jgi:hypothetical protein
VEQPRTKFQETKKEVKKIMQITQGALAMKHLRGSASSLKWCLHLSNDTASPLKISGV